MITTEKQDVEAYLANLAKFFGYRRPSEGETGVRVGSKKPFKPSRTAQDAGPKSSDC